MNRFILFSYQPNFSPSCFEMIRTLFILNILTDIVVGSTGAAYVNVHDGKTETAASVQIICEHQHGSETLTDPTAEKFNQFVTNYFVANFGPGGRKYLEFVRDKITPCVNISPQSPSELSIAYKNEVNQINRAFDESSWFWTRKRLDQVRFRVHRFLGILILCKSGSCLLDSSLIDYHKAFPRSKDRSELDRHLLIFRVGVQMPNPSVVFETDANLVSMVKDCLRLIGDIVRNESDKSGALEKYAKRVEKSSKDARVVWLSSPFLFGRLVVENFKQKCLWDTKTTTVAKTKVCELLPKTIQSTTLENIAVCRVRLSDLFEENRSQFKTGHQSFYNILGIVLERAAKMSNDCTDTGTDYLAKVNTAVERIVQLIFDINNVFYVDKVGIYTDVCLPGETSEFDGILHKILLVNVN
jgi:hypothetical protein